MAAIIVGNSAFEIQDDCIISYGVSNGEINYSDEGKLTSIDRDSVNAIEKALQIDSIEDFGVTIMDNEMVEL